MEEMTIRENMRAVEDRIAAACQEAGRKPEDVTLIAVSKTKPVEMLREAYECGCRDFGENTGAVGLVVFQFHALPSSLFSMFTVNISEEQLKFTS